MSLPKRAFHRRPSHFQKTPSTMHSYNVLSALLLAAPAFSTLTPDNTCGNVANGKNKGYTCDPSVSNGGPCCSSSGYCGSRPSPSIPNRTSLTFHRNDFRLLRCRLPIRLRRLRNLLLPRSSEVRLHMERRQRWRLHARPNLRLHHQPIPSDRTCQKHRLNRCEW